MPFNHLYIHVPFCRRRCSYCDFAIAVRKTVPGPRFVDAVCREIEGLPAADIVGIGPLETVYVGGGTPSLLDAGQLRRLLARVRAAFGLAPGAEVTMEANPEDVDAATAGAWVGAGINRVSLGVQSLDRAVLAWMHRSHAAETSLNSARIVRDAGIPSVSVDVIFGLPERFGVNSVEEAKSLIEAVGPQHLSAYGLTVEPSTALSRWVERGVVQPASSEAHAERFLQLHEMLGEAGYEHYEVSNYARPGHRSRHNQVYWSGRSYLGIGPSAHSFDGRRRWWNVRDWTAYERRIASGNLPIADHEVLSEDQLRLERVYLGLRDQEGVDAEDVGLLPAGSVSSSIEQGWLVHQDGRLKATPEGWLRLDALAARLGDTLTTSAGGG